MGTKALTFACFGVFFVCTMYAQCVHNAYVQFVLTFSVGCLVGSSIFDNAELSESVSEPSEIVTFRRNIAQTE